MFTDQLIPSNRPADPQIPVCAFHDAAVIVAVIFQSLTGPSFHIIEIRNYRYRIVI